MRIASVVILSATLAIAGCGQMGPLYFDEAPPADQLPPSSKAPPATVPQPAPQSGTPLPATSGALPADTTSPNEDEPKKTTK